MRPRNAQLKQLPKIPRTLSYYSSRKQVCVHQYEADPRMHPMLLPIAD